jgi:hypothetical protein
MDVSKVQVLLEGYNGKWEQGWSFWHGAPQGEWFALDTTLDATTVSSIGGIYDEDSSHVEVIVRVAGLEWNDHYFSMSGYYSSYNGIEWDGQFTEVTPYEVKTVAYRRL